MKYFGLALLLAAVVSAGPLPDNVNPNGVANCNSTGQNCLAPTVGEEFTILRPWVITLIATYQNDGSNSTGATPGSIGFYDVWNEIVYSWASDPSSTDTYWVAFPNAILPAGTYRVWSSDPESWSYNGATGYADAGQTQHIGMARAQGYEVPEPASIILVGSSILALGLSRRILRVRSSAH